MSDTIDQLLDLVSSDWHKTALFIGSGYSRPSGIPTWSDFIRELTGMAGINEEGMRSVPLPEQADIAKRSLLGSDRYEAFLADTFTRGVYNPYHEVLAQLPAPLLVTTNYDTFIEDAWREVNGKRLKVREFAVDYRPRDPDAQLIKLHGSVNDPKKMIVTQSDYDELYGDELFTSFLRHLFVHFNVVFLGFSMSDPDLAHILGTSVTQVARHPKKPLASRRFLVLTQTDALASIPGRSYRQTEVVALPSHAENLELLRNLRRRVSRHSPELHYRKFQLRCEHTFVDDDSFRVAFHINLSGVCTRESTPRVQHKYFTDAQPPYGFNSFSGSLLRAKAPANVDVALSTAVFSRGMGFVWALEFSRPLLFGEEFEAEVLLSWERDHPIWLEDAGVPTSGYPADRGMHSHYVAVPTNEIELTAVFPPEYPIDEGDLRAVIVREPTKFEARTELRSLIIDANWRGVTLTTKSVDLDLEYGVEWKLPRRPATVVTR